MIELELDDLRGAAGLGVAGNFAGHLEQAGEDVDFASVRTAEPEAPRGIFPFYVPGASTFLGTFPLSHDRLVKPPATDGPVNLQIEPEVGLACRVRYAEGVVTALAPFAVGAFNDCSIRRPGAPKISHKKNWGAAAKGVARRCFAVDDLAADGPTATLRLVSFLRRDGATHAYGVDSPLTGYSYYGRRLLDWLVDRLAHQEGADGTPLEPVGAYLREAGCPERALIGIGATRYTELGATTYLEGGDESVVVVYDGAAYDAEAIETAVRDGREWELTAASVLVQAVDAA